MGDQHTLAGKNNQSTSSPPKKQSDKFIIVTREDANQVSTSGPSTGMFLFCTDMHFNNALHVPKIDGY